MSLPISDIIKRKRMALENKMDRSKWSAHLRRVKKYYKPGTLDYLESLTGGITMEYVLKKEGITLAEFRTLILYQKDFSYGRDEIPVLCQSLKDFFERHGFIVNPEPRDKGIGWLVSCRGQE